MSYRRPGPDYFDLLRGVGRRFTIPAWTIGSLALAAGDLLSSLGGDTP